MLGSAWTLLQPLAMTAVYYALFSYLFPNHSIQNYALFILTGLILWNYFANCLKLGTLAIHRHLAGCLSARQRDYRHAPPADLGARRFDARPRDQSCYLRR